MTDAFIRWRDEALGITVAFWKVWTPAHIVTFGLMPEPLRITWVASVSFFWLIIKSTMVHRGYEADKGKQERGGAGGAGGG